MEEQNKNQDLHKVVLVTDEDTQQKDGPHLNMRDYGRSVSHFKYWLLGLTACLGVIGYLVTKFAVNPSREKMTTNIDINLAISEDKKTYLNGQSYAFSDIISKENIEEVIKNNEDFSNLSYDLFANNQTFLINQQTVTENNVTTPIENKYTISTSLRVFNSTSQAQNFVKALLSNIESKAHEGIEAFQYKNVLPNEEDSLTSMEFSDIISELNEQYTYLESSYKKMTTFFGSYTIVNGKTLDEHYSNFKANHTQNTFTSLKGELTKNKYINISSLDDVDEKIKQYNFLSSSYQIQFKDIAANIESDKEMLKILSTSQVNDTIAEKITALTDEIAELEAKKRDMVQTLQDIGYKIKDSGGEISIDGYDETNQDTYLYKLNNADQTYIDKCVSFKGSLISMYDNLNKITQTASETYRRAYLMSKKNEIIISDSNVSGHISSPLVAMISAAATFAVASFIFAEIFINKEYSKNNNTKAQDECSAS